MERLLSIIIPAYNCEDYLSEGVDSVLCRLPDDCELIVVDDGSRDNTRSLLAQYEGRQDNLKILYAEHRGASGARNTGLDAASGRYAAFMDCDDCMQEEFLEKSLPLLASGADLYIFGFERVFFDGRREPSVLPDRSYRDISEFADDYIRNRRLLVYSASNKFYRRSVIEALHLRFDEGSSFGEDRLFNFGYLPGCKNAVTSSLIMFYYMQRSAESMSSRHIPHYFDRVMELHRAKMDCFLNLSKGTTEEEKQSFVRYDREREAEKTAARFSGHPEEREENLPKILAMRAAQKRD